MTNEENKQPEEAKKIAEETKKNHEEHMDSDDERMHGFGRHGMMGRDGKPRSPRKIKVYKVLLICNTDYDPSLCQEVEGKYYPLPSCEDDLALMLDWINRSHFNQVVHIISKNATKEELAKTMADFKADCFKDEQREDVEAVVVLVYYTGHGANRNEGGMLSTYIVHKEFNSYTNIAWYCKNLSFLKR